LYSQPIIDNETHETLPLPHLRISGHFEGTTVDFNIYLPENGWKGRFFQLVYPLQNSTASDREISFGADSGGYTIRASGLPTYRGDAAAAKVGMMIARELVEGSELEPAIERLFAEPGAAYLHLHYAAPGCYAAKVERA